MAGTPGHGSLEGQESNWEVKAGGGASGGSRQEDGEEESEQGSGDRPVRNRKENMRVSKLEKARCMRCKKYLGNNLSGLGAWLGVSGAAPGFLSWGPSGRWHQQLGEPWRRSECDLAFLLHFGRSEVGCSTTR